MSWGPFTVSPETNPLAQIALPTCAHCCARVDNTLCLIVIVVSRRGLLEDMCCHEDADEHELGPTPPFCTSFFPNSHVAACGDEEGVIRLLDTSRNREWNDGHRTQFLAHANAIFCLEWVPGAERTLTGSGDQTIRLFDVRTQSELSVFIGHRASVKAVSCFDAHVFASGGRDGTVCIWDSRLAEPRPCVIVANAHASHTPQSAGAKRRRGAAHSIPNVQSVSSVVFVHDEYAKLATAGATDGAIKLWDLRALRGETSAGGGGGSAARATSKARAPAPTVILRPPCSSSSSSSSSSGGGGQQRPRGITSLAVDAASSRLLATTTSSIVYMYDTRWFSEAPRVVAGSGSRRASSAGGGSSGAGGGGGGSGSSAAGASESHGGGAGEGAVAQFSGHRVDSF